MNPDAHRENVRVVMFGKMAAVRELLREMGDIEIIEYEDATTSAFGYWRGTEDADMILIYAPYAEGLLSCGLMAGERICPVRLLPEYPCEAARFELRFTLEKVKYPAAGNGVFDPCGSRQISMQAWLLGSLLAEIKKKRKSMSSRGSWPAADEEAEYGK